MATKTMDDPRQMGRKKKAIDSISVRIETDAYEVARQVATMTGESIIIAMSRLVRDGGNAELLANAKRVVERLEGGASPKAKAKRKGETPE